MKKKFILTLGFSVVLLANPLTFSYAKSELVEGRALGMAQQYIENSLGDEAWKGNNPVVSAQSKFYTDDEKKISYIEYKVSCDSTPNCGFIMMNVDGNDVSVPIASPSGNTPSEILDQGETVDEKFYYFGPFDLYSENEVTGDVQALDPQVAVDLRSDDVVKRSVEEKKALKEQRDSLKAKLEDAKLTAKDFKKSDEFKKQKEEIKDQILNVPKEEFSMKMLDIANAQVPDTNTTYTLPGVSDTFIPSAVNYSSIYCSGKTPCYNQFIQNYSGANGTNCHSGCTPTAVAILYGYYDRNGFPNLILGGNAPDYGTGSVVQGLVNSVRSYMGSSCISVLQPNGSFVNESSTNSSNVYKAKSYAIAMGYAGTTATSFTGQTVANVFTKLKTEINAGRPAIIDVFNTTVGHSVVGFGYKSTGTAFIARVNMGWGGQGYYSSSGTNYYWSNIDQDLNAFFFKPLNDKKAKAITTFKILN